MTVIDILDMLNNDMTPPQTIMFGGNVLSYDREQRTYYDISGESDIMDIIGQSYWSLEQLYKDDIKVKDENEKDREYYKNVKKEILKYAMTIEDNDKKEIIRHILEILTKEYFK